MLLGATALAWNFGLGLTHLLLPLYAAHLGLGAARIGAVLGLPILVQLALGLFGGAATDRWGGRGVLRQAAATLALGALMCLAAGGFWSLLAAQLFLTYSRGVYWPASQAIAAALPGERSVQLGRLNTLMSLGQISGTASAGVLVAVLGYPGTFVVLAAVGAAALGAALRLPADTVAGGQRPLFMHFPPLLRQRAMYFALLAAFLCAQPVSMSQSFYPLLLRELGFSAQAAGLLLALRPLGAAAATLLLARLLGSRAALPLAVAAGLGLAVGLELAPYCAALVPAALTIAGIGLASGVLLLYYQLVIAATADPAARGSALAIGGAGWSLSHLIGPFAVGLLAERVGLGGAFLVWGAVTLGLALALLPVYAWMQRGTGAAATFN